MRHVAVLAGRGGSMRSVGGCLLALLVVACAPDPGAEEAARKPELGSALADIVPAELLLEANHGREVLRSDGYFAFPRRVRRVWVDVGAHHLETSRTELRRNPDLGLVAIEPLSECWARWPDKTRLIGLPVAINLERGWQDFHVNRHDQASSLAKSLPGGDEMQVVEVRSVPVIRLDDVLERIPPELDIEFLKTDVQGLDLQVLKSAGDHLRRVARVKTEIITARVYEGVGGEGSKTEQEYLDYMASMGFAFVRDIDVEKTRSWLDKEFVNTQRLDEPAR
jgi:FkbM family methyltransferase